MANINKAAVFNPLPELVNNILDYVPRATTTEFGIVAIGSGIKVDPLGRIYLDTQELSDQLDAIEDQVNAIGVGNKAYKTYALMDADKANIPAESKVTVTNDETASNNGDWQWDGAVFTKSVFDLLTQAKNFAMSEDSNLRKSIESDIFVSSSNLFDKEAVLLNTTVETDGSVVSDTIRWLSDYIACSPSDVFSLTSGSYRIAYFDKNKNFISSTSPSSIAGLTVPANNSIAYFRLSATTLLASMQVNSGSILLPYEPYFLEVKNELIPEIPKEKIPVVIPNMTNFFNLSKNLFNKGTILPNTSIELDGTVVSDATRWLSDYIPCDASEVFSLTNGSYRIAYFGENKNFIERSGVNSNVFTVLTNTKIKFMRLSSTINASTVMLNKGSTLLAYEDYEKAVLKDELTPEISKEKLPIVIPEMTSFFDVPRNLFNKNTVLPSTSLDETGVIVADPIRWLSDYIECTAQEVFSLPSASYRVAYYDKDKNFIIRSGASASPITVLNRPNIKYMRLSSNVAFETLMLNKGNTLLPYENFGATVLKKQYAPAQLPVEIPVIEPEMTSFFEVSKNLFNKDTALLNTSIELDGGIVSDGIRWLSDYIPVTPNSDISLPNASFRIACFSANKTFIIRSGVAPSSNQVVYRTRPDTHFIRISGTFSLAEMRANNGTVLLPFQTFGEVLIKPEYLPENISQPEIDIDQIASEVQQRIGSGLNWEPSFPKLNFSIVESGSWRNPMWMNSEGTIIYGAYGDQLIQSTDEWTTHVQIGTTGFVRTIAGIRTLDDGELLVATNRSDVDSINSKVYKTVGYDPLNPSATTFKEVLTTGASQANINNRWGLTTYQNICTASDYGLKGVNGAQNVYLSTDYGETWRLIFNLRTQVVNGRPPLTDSAHVHTTAYDPYFNRIWVAVGDNPNTATYYSDDLGKTWTFVLGSTKVQYTGIIALPDSVVFGSDRSPNGVHVYQRKDRSEMPVIKPLFLINDTPTITHVFTLPFKKDWSPNTPVYFVGNNTTTSVNDKPVIMGLVDGKKAHLLYEHSGVDSLETALGPTAQGNIISSYSTTGVSGRFIIKAKAPNWQKL